MGEYVQKKCEHLISGYLHKITNKHKPNEIIKLIEKFYEKYTLFNVYGMRWNSENSFKIGNTHSRFFINWDTFFFINEYNGLFYRGNNSCGQIGINSFKDHLHYVLKEHSYFKNKSIDLISKGISNYHCFVYTFNKLYVFGRNYEQQFGVKTDKDKINSPTLIEYKFGSKLKQINCGSSHSLFLTIKGNVYGCGSNVYGQLGTKYISNNGIQKISDIHNIVSVGCCQSSSFIWDINGILRSFGRNNAGQLGINKPQVKNTTQNDMKLVLNGRKIKKYSCGYAYIGVILNTNELYMFGVNTNSQCGIINMNNGSIHDGNRIVLRDDIIGVHCGGSHTIIKTNKETFYSFGNNRYKQLLIRIDLIVQHNPTLIQNEYLYELTGSNDAILDILPSYDQTFIIQKCNHN